MATILERFREQFQVWRTDHMPGVGQATVILTLEPDPTALYGQYFILVPKAGAKSGPLDVPHDLKAERVRFGSFPERLADVEVDSEFALGWLRGIAEGEVIDIIEDRWRDAASAPPFDLPEVRLIRADPTHLAQMKATGRGVEHLEEIMYNGTFCTPLREALRSLLSVPRIRTGRADV